MGSSPGATTPWYQRHNPFVLWLSLPTIGAGADIAEAIFLPRWLRRRQENRSTLGQADFAEKTGAARQD
jgi:hypothetical protein